jgi:cytochrome c biogenesis protein CcmG/thiol:disulfide interchange protein DsbE
MENEMVESSETVPPGQTRKGRSSAWIAAGIIGLVVLALLGYALMADPVEPPQIDSAVPDFQHTALDGSPMNLSDHRGEVVVLNFFASWCDPCQEEAAALEQTWRAYQGRGVQFLGIAYKDADSKAQAFLNRFGVSYPSTVDRSNRTARAYGVTGVPETFVIDQQGLLARHFLGSITQAQLSQEIDRLLAP